MKRLFWILAMATTTFLALSQPQKKKDSSMKFSLKPLPYSYTALEPWLDATTLTLHHDKHQATYVNNLNNALAKYPDYHFRDKLCEILKDIDSLPEDIRTAVRNNGGGVFNHEFYWEGLSGAPSVPSKRFADAIDKSFGSMENFRREMTEKSLSLFGSGYTWLCSDRNGNLKIIAYPNQDNPFSCPCKCASKLTPIFCIDVWEHSYYLKYQNLRAEYLKNIWNIVNWQKLSERYEKTF
jgi:Fe-Mn family superoxide dismutase